MKNKSFVLILLLLLSVYSPVSAQDIYDEGVKTLQAYLSIDTTNPPGNEMKTAEFLKEILDKEGIENEIFDLGNNRADLFAILKGDGSKKPVIFLHHMDVVPADSKYWKVPPFSGEIINGEIYGRGAIDIKGKGIIDLMTMISLKRMNFPLKRDIIFLAVSDEEINSIGTTWMIENKPMLLKNAEFLIDEGGRVTTDEKGNVRCYLVTIAEKSPLWLTLTFTGTPGHGSIPMNDSAVNRTIRAAKRILDYNMEFMVKPEMKEYIKMLLEKEDMTKIPGYAEDFDSSLKNRTFLEEISKNPEINAALRNTISITCLKGSDKINTIPNEASVSLDCRLLPGTDRDKFIENLKEIVKDETVQIKIEEYYSSASSPADTDFIKALKVCAEKRAEGTRVIPSILLCSTDSSLYRALGINAYGFKPYRLTPEEDSGLSHGNDERISVENIKFGIDLLMDLMKELNK